MAEAKEKPTYNTDRLAKDLGILPASVRVALRKHGIKKPGKAYEWPTRAAYDEVLKKLKASASEDDDKPSKPAKVGKVKEAV